MSAQRKLFWQNWQRLFFPRWRSFYLFHSLAFVASSFYVRRCRLIRSTVWIWAGLCVCVTVIHLSFHESPSIAAYRNRRNFSRYDCRVTHASGKKTRIQIAFVWLCLYTLCVCACLFGWHVCERALTKCGVVYGLNNARLYDCVSATHRLSANFCDFPRNSHRVLRTQPFRQRRTTVHITLTRSHRRACARALFLPLTRFSASVRLYYGISRVKPR